MCLFVLILYVPSTIFRLNRDGSSLVEPVLSWDKCVLLKDHNAVTPVRLKPVAPRSQIKHYHCAPYVTCVNSYGSYRTIDLVTYEADILQELSDL